MLWNCVLLTKKEVGIFTDNMCREEQNSSERICILTNNKKKETPKQENMAIFFSKTRARKSTGLKYWESLWSGVNKIWERRGKMLVWTIVAVTAASEGLKVLIYGTFFAWN